MFTRIRVCLLLLLVFFLTSALISAPALYAELLVYLREVELYGPYAQVHFGSYFLVQ